MSDKSILSLATDREPQQKKVQGAVKRSLLAAPGALQHCVIYGPRGFGKSFMTRLIQIETQNLALTQALPIPFVLLPEEQQNLTRNPHALPSYIAHRLADLRSGEDSSWGQAMFQWPEPNREAELWDEAIIRLELELDLSLPEGCGLAIVVIENFDLLLTTVFKDPTAEQRLRKWLDRPKNRLMLIATATGSVDMDYDRPLFQAFQSVKLSPWSQEACITYFNRRRGAEGLAPLAKEMEAKARAIADFIGGNPRLAQLLADVLETQDALSVAGTMNELADKLSDYYRRRIDDLPPLARGLLDALIRGGEPASQTELAVRVNASSQSQIARVMQELIRSDIINGIPARDSRETLYRVTDRVFVHFYRLRQGNQLTVKTPLTTILDFLRAFYSVDEQKRHAMEHLRAGRSVEGRLFADLALENGPGLKVYSSYSSNFGQRIQRLITFRESTLPLATPSILSLLSDCPEELIQTLSTWSIDDSLGKVALGLIEAQALANMGLSDKSTELLEQLLLTTDDHIAQIFLHYELLSLTNLREDKPGSTFHIKKLISASTTELPDLIKILLLRVRARSLLIDHDYAEAIDTAKEAITLSEIIKNKDEEAMSLRWLIWIYSQLEDDKNVIKISEPALRLSKQIGAINEQVIILALVTSSHGRLRNIESMLAAALSGEQLAKEIGDKRRQGIALGEAAWALDSLGRYEEAIATGRKAAELASTIGNTGEHIFSLRTLAWSLYKTNHYEESLATARKAASAAEKTNFQGEYSESIRIAAKSLAALYDYNSAMELCLKANSIARRIKDKWTLQGSARDLITYAGFVPSKDAIDIFLDQVLYEIKNPTHRRGADWSLWLNDLFSASVNISDWTALDILIDEHLKEIDTEQLHATSVIGKAIAQVGKNEGTAAGYNAASNSIVRINRLMASDKTELETQSLWISDMMSGFAMVCRDADLIRSVANLLKSQEEQEGHKQANLLLSLAEVLDSGDPEGFLTRTDPDVAVWLRRNLNMPETIKKSQRRKKRKT